MAENIKLNIPDKDEYKVTDTINVTKPDIPEIEDYIKYLKEIWKNEWLTNDGEFLRLFEIKLKEHLKLRNVIVVSNGTLAIHMALKALNIKGDVITTPFTFSATTNALIWEGLNPVFADIDSETFNIYPSDVEKKITDETSAILAVHVYGNPCYVEELQEISIENDIKLIYDSAHSFGVEYKKKSVLNYGDISTLSFHATKVFNTVEGGAITAQDEKILEKLKLLRNHGIKSEEEVLLPGTNAKMNEFQAAMGLCNIKIIEDKLKQRKELYDHYKENLASFDNIKFQKLIASKYNYSYMPVCFENIKVRDKIYSELIKDNIYSRKYFYPLTVNYDYFKQRGQNLVQKYDLKVASDISDRVLCLPLYPDLGENVVDKITNRIKELMSN
jgi:dTDP-4-amino-4,6-dideoxygalactose transaminase